MTKLKRVEDFKQPKTGTKTKRSQSDFRKHLNRCANCKEKFIIAVEDTDISVRKKKVIFAILPLRCKSYYCENCVKAARQKFIDKYKTELAGQTWRFLTLTTINKYDNTEINLLSIEGDWNRLLARLRKKKIKFSYIKVVEIGENGMVHIHALINKYVPQIIIQKAWKELTGASRVEIKFPRKIRNAILYMYGYIQSSTKVNKHSNLFYLLNKRRFNTSRNLKPLKSDASIFYLLCKSIYPLKDLNQEIQKLIDIYGPETEIDLTYITPP